MAGVSPADSSSPNTPAFSLPGAADASELEDYAVLGSSSPSAVAHTRSQHESPAIPSFRTSAASVDDDMEMGVLDPQATPHSTEKRQRPSLTDKVGRARLKSQVAEDVIELDSEGHIPDEDEVIPKHLHDQTTGGTLSGSSEKSKKNAFGHTPSVVSGAAGLFAVFQSEERKTAKKTISVVLKDEEDLDSKLIFSPRSRFTKTWNIMTSVVVIYIVAVVSFDLGFGWWKPPTGVFIVNILVDIYCWIDMAVTFRTGFVHAGHLVLDSKKIALQYMQFWFWIDLTANVPWELLLSFSKSKRKAVKFVKWLKLPRLLRLGKLRKLMQGHARYLNMVVFMSTLVLCIHLGACIWTSMIDPCSAMKDLSPFADWEHSHEVDEDLVMRHPQLGWECAQKNIINVYFQAIHAATGMLLGVDKATYGGYTAGGGESSWLWDEVKSYSEHLMATEIGLTHNSAAARMRAIKLLLLWRRYPLSLSDSMILGSTLAAEQGHDNLALNGIEIQAEGNYYGMEYAFRMNFFGTCMLMLGLYLQGMLFANITKIVVFRNASESSFRQAHDEVKRELEMFGHLLPEQLQERIQKYFSFRWVNQAYGPLTILRPDLLSNSLRAEIAVHLYRESVSKVEFLTNAPIDILEQVCLKLERQYYMQHDAIYRKGESPTGLFIIELGKVWISPTYTFAEAVASDDNRRDVHPGEAFGVGACIAAIQPRTHRERHHNRSKALNRKSAFAVTVCNLMWLSLEVLQELCHDYPWFFKELLELEQDEQDHGHGHGIDEMGATPSERQGGRIDKSFCFQKMPSMGDSTDFDAAASENRRWSRPNAAERQRMSEVAAQQQQSDIPMASSNTLQTPQWAASRTALGDRNSNTSGLSTVAAPRSSAVSNVSSYADWSDSDPGHLEQIPMDVGSLEERVEALTDLVTVQTQKLDKAATILKDIMSLVPK